MKGRLRVDRPKRNLETCRSLGRENIDVGEPVLMVLHSQSCEQEKTTMIRHRQRRQPLAATCDLGERYELESHADVLDEVKSIIHGTTKKSHFRSLTDTASSSSSTAASTSGSSEQESISQQEQLRRHQFRHSVRGRYVAKPPPRQPRVARAKATKPVSLQDSFSSTTDTASMTEHSEFSLSLSHIDAPLDEILQQTPPRSVSTVPETHQESLRRSLYEETEYVLHTGPVDVDEMKPIVDLEDDAYSACSSTDEDYFYIYDDYILDETDFEKCCFGYEDGFEPPVEGLISSPSHQARRRFSEHVIPEPICEATPMVPPISTQYIATSLRSGKRSDIGQRYQV